MAHKVVLGILSVCLLTCITVVCLVGQEPKAVAGKWSMTSETDGDPVKWTLVLKESEGQLTAFLSTDDGEQPAKEFTFANGVLKFKVAYQDKDYLIELKASPEKLEGTWSGDGNSGKTSGTRR